VSRLEAWLVHVSTLLVGVTGLLYAWMRYLMAPAEPFAVVNHPLQPTVQHLHVWTAPLLVFAAGVIWREHVWKHWRRGIRPRRRSGISLVLTLVPMVASGYLIQTAVTPGWRTAWVAIHLTTSGLWLAAYLLHQLLPWWARRRSAGDEGPVPGPAAAAGLLALLALGLALAAGCREEAPPVEEAPEARPVTLASGIDEAILGPLLARFSERTGHEVEARYGDSEELAAQLAAGEGTPPQVFVSRDAPSLGRVAAAGRFLPLPADLVGEVPANFADPERRWVGIAGRARALVYAPDRVAEEELPRSLSALAAPRFHGRLVLAPSSPAFVDHMAAYRALNGAAALDELLAGLAAGDPVIAADERAVAEEVLAGRADLGLADLAEALAVPAGAGAEPLGLRVLASADASGLIDLVGAGVTAENPAAIELLRFLLGDEAQAQLARETRWYPLVAGVELAGAPAALADLAPPRIDFAAVAAAEEAAREAIAASGLGGF